MVRNQEVKEESQSCWKGAYFILGEHMTVQITQRCLLARIRYIMNYLYYLVMVSLTSDSSYLKSSQKTTVAQCLKLCWALTAFIYSLQGACGSQRTTPDAIPTFSVV